MRSWKPETSFLRRLVLPSRYGRWLLSVLRSSSVLGCGGSRWGTPALSFLHAPGWLAFFLRFLPLLFSGHRSRPAGALWPSSSTAFAPAGVVFLLGVFQRLRFASALLLFGMPSAVFSPPMVMHTPSPNPALNLAPFGRWTLRDKPAQRPLALR